MAGMPDNQQARIMGASIGVVAKRYAAALRRCNMDVPDAVQQILIECLRSWDSYDPARSCVSTWATAIASRRIHDVLDQAKAYMRAAAKPHGNLDHLEHKGGVDYDVPELTLPAIRMATYASRAMRCPIQIRRRPGDRCPIPVKTREAACAMFARSDLGPWAFASLVWRDPRLRKVLRLGRPFDGEQLCRWCRHSQVYRQIVLASRRPSPMRLALIEEVGHV